jgi:hypothetical protein
MLHTQVVRAALDYCNADSDQDSDYDSDDY